MFRWFVGLKTDDPVWHSITFTKNRDRLLNEDLIAKFLELLLATPEGKPLLSSEHVSVDGTSLQAWASHGSLERIDDLDDELPPPSGGRGLGSSATGASNVPNATSAGRCSRTRPTAPKAIERPGCSRRLLVLVPF